MLKYIDFVFEASYEMADDLARELDGSLMNVVVVVSISDEENGIRLYFNDGDDLSELTAIIAEAAERLM